MKNADIVTALVQKISLWKFVSHNIHSHNKTRRSAEWRHELVEDSIESIHCYIFISFEGIHCLHGREAIINLYYISIRVYNNSATHESIECSTKCVEHETKDCGDVEIMRIWWHRTKYLFDRNGFSFLPRWIIVLSLWIPLLHLHLIRFFHHQVL